MAATQPLSEASNTPQKIVNKKEQCVAEKCQVVLHDTARGTPSQRDENHYDENQCDENQQGLVTTSIKAWRSTMKQSSKRKNDAVLLCNDPIDNTELPMDNKTMRLLQRGLSSRLSFVRARAAERTLVRQSSFVAEKQEERDWQVGTEVDCLGRDVKWRRGVVRAVCRSTQGVLVRYSAPPIVLGGLPTTEWVDVTEGAVNRLRPRGTFTNDDDVGMPSELPTGTKVQVASVNLADRFGTRVPTWAEWHEGSVLPCTKEDVTVVGPVSGAEAIECNVGEGRIRLLQVRRNTTDREWKHQKVENADTEFYLPADYSVESLLGQGSYGQVCSATKLDTGEKVAIKKIAGLGEFDNLHSIRMLREVKCLKHLKGHPNVVTLHEVLVPPTSSPQKRLTPLQRKAQKEGRTLARRNLEPQRAHEIYLVFELAFTDLGKVLRSKYELGPDHVQFLVYQCLRGLAHCHAAGVMHRDLKPDNLLLEQDCTLKITDFGLAVGNGDPSASLSNYVVTRWYRSPELLLAQEDFEYDKLFTPAVDIWSVGCIFGELLRRKALFPGESTVHQLQLIMTVLGAPEPGHCSHVTDPELLKYLATAGQPAIRLEECLPRSATSAAADLLEKMLTFDPARRISAVEALRHPYFADLHDGSSDLGAGEGVPLELQVDPDIANDTALDALLEECARVVE